MDSSRNLDLVTPSTFRSQASPDTEVKKCISLLDEMGWKSTEKGLGKERSEDCSHFGNVSHLPLARKVDWMWVLVESNN
jgi:hypothetical protein